MPTFSPLTTLRSVPDCRSRHIAAMRAVLCLLAVAAAACGKPKVAVVEDQGGGAGAGVAAVDPAPAAEAAAEAAAVATEAAAAAAQATATEAAAAADVAALDPAAGDTIALFLGSPQSETFALPTPGKAARVRVTPVDGMGHPVADLVDLGGSTVMMVAMRSDFAWAEIRAPNAGAGPAVTFDLTFPLPGPHTLMFGYQRQGSALHTESASVRVLGDWQAAEMSEISLSHSTKGVAADLALPPDGLVACTRATLAVSWRLRGKKASVTTAQLAAVPLARDSLIVGTVSESGGTLRFPAAGLWSVLVRGVAGKTTVTAHFQVRVGGEAPATGCAAEPATGAAVAP